MSTNDPALRARMLRNRLDTVGFSLTTDEIDAVLEAAYAERVAITWPEHVRLVHEAQDKAIESMEDTTLTDAAYNDGYAHGYADALNNINRLHKAQRPTEIAG